MDEQQTEGTAIAVIEETRQRANPPALIAGSSPRAIVPVDFEGAWRIAKAVSTAGMAPKTLNTPEKCMVAILHGLEVGLTPMNALQSIAVIGGRPTIYGDGAIGLIRASGKLEYMHEKLVGEGDSLKAICTVKRKGEPEAVTSEFSWLDAKKANLTGKEGPWQSYPKRMLQMRARWSLRDVFADVLKGLALKEEVEDMEAAEQIASAPAPAQLRAPAPPADEPVDEKPAEGQAEAEPEPEPEPKVEETKKADAGDIPPFLDRRGEKPKLSDDERDWLDGLNGAFSGCEDFSSLADEQNRLMTPRKDKVSINAWRAADVLVRENIARIEQGN